MPFHKKIFKEILRPFKQTAKEIGRFAKKVEQEDRRIRNQVLTATGLKQPDPLPLPPLPAPLATPVVGGGASNEIRRRQRGRVSGRRKTIVTGDLSPAQVGKKTLLGR